MLIKEGLYKVKGVSLEKDELDYGSLAEIKNLLDRLGVVEPHNSYITDYFQNRILFISESCSRFCGFTQEDVDELGEGIYRKMFPAEDMPIHIRFADAIMTRFYDLPVEDRPYASASYNFPLIRKDGRKIGVYRRTCPLKIFDDGRMWLSISCINYSSSNEIGSLFYTLRNKNQTYAYSLETGEWIDQEPVILSEKEKLTAIEIFRGTLDKHIADMLCVSKDTISYYKKQIMQKTSTTTMHAALEFLVRHYII